MSLVPLLFGIIAGAGVFLIVIGLSRPTASIGDMVQERLKHYEGDRPLSLEEVELQKPFSERLLKPGLERLSEALSRRTPEKARQDLQNRLNLAGRPGNLSPSEFQAVRYVAAVILCLAGVALGLFTHSTLFMILFPVLGLGMGFYLPVMWIKQKVDGHRKEIQLALPDAMDLLTIAVEAGLSFDAAMARLTEKFKNALANEFAIVLQETRLGRPRLEALDDMGRRTGVEDLHNFVQAVIQSEQMGVGIAKILRLQSDEIRRKRRQRAQEKAAQASLKMMLPMVGCIFPTLWIVLLGPAVLILMKVKGL